MQNHPVKRIRLIKILRAFGVDWNPARGKGAHGMFSKMIDGKAVSYPIPGDDETLQGYVAQCRRKFKLTPDDGVSDRDFYDAA